MSIWEILKMLFPMIVIIAILAVALYYVKKKQFRFGNGKNKVLKIDLISAKPIMPKKYIAAVRVEEKVLILGVSDYSINVLREFDYDPQKFEYEYENKKDVKSFLKLLKKNMREDEK